MASGPEHYREAERLLNTLNVVGHPTPAQVLQVQTAQVHALLALAAATALNDGNVRAPIADCQAWVKVASVVPEVER